MALGCMHNARSKLSSRNTLARIGASYARSMPQWFPCFRKLSLAESNLYSVLACCNALARESEVVWTNIDSVDKAPFVAAAEAARSTTLHQRWNRHGAYLKLTGKQRLACNKIWIFLWSQSANLPPSLATHAISHTIPTCCQSHCIEYASKSKPKFSTKDSRSLEQNLT